MADRPRERWSIEAGSAEVALLDIPADARRERVFEIDCRFVVRAQAEGAWLELRIEIDGALQWQRRIQAHAVGQADSLDHHCRRQVPLGRAMRVRALARSEGALRQRLSIEAEEN